MKGKFPLLYYQPLIEYLISLQSVGHIERPCHFIEQAFGVVLVLMEQAPQKILTGDVIYWFKIENMLFNILFIDLLLSYF